MQKFNYYSLQLIEFVAVIPPKRHVIYFNLLTEDLFQIKQQIIILCKIPHIFFFF